MQAGQQPGLFWLGQEDAANWAAATGQQLDNSLAPVFGGGFHVELKLPSAEDAKKKVAANLDLLGELAVTWKNSPDTLRLEIALPYHGVFVKRNRNSTVPSFAVWAAWLGERPGFRYFQKKPDDKKSIFWRLGLPGGDYVQAQCGRKGDFSDSLRVLPPRDVWPEFLQEISQQQGPVDVPSKANASRGHRFWKQVHALASKKKNLKSIKVTDVDHLEHRVLVTFPVWLKAKLSKAIINNLLCSGNKSVEAAFSNKPLTNSDARQRLWNRLIQEPNSLLIAGDLFPEGWERDQTFGAQNRFEPLQWVEPENPVDLAALLTQVQRYQMRRDALKRLPAKYRQNHSSFRGCICPVQTPESELVGLTLHLARGAQVNWNGEITPANKDHPHDELGFAAGLIPFYEHNDGARCMMGAKNLRQAVPVAKPHEPAVRTGGEEVIAKFVQPLVHAGMCPGASDAGGNLALGVDLLVAYLPWYGMNVDDAIVVGQQIVEEGLLDIKMREGFRKALKPGWERIIHSNIEGGPLYGGDLIAKFRHEDPKEPRDYKLRYSDRSPATLETTEHLPKPASSVAALMGSVVEYELVRNFKLGLGDKLMGRHGNKGVIGAILSSDRMPRLPQDDSLPAHLRGRPIDILLNPHGVISRMNLGQLLETHIGWLLHMGCKQEEFTREGIPSEAGIGQPFLGAMDHGKVQQLLEKSGLDRFGRIRLLLPDGSQTCSPVVVGFQHIVRLRHIPELKVQARKGGTGAQYSPVTGQAAHGRTHGGGQRVGEMEVWALAGHQAEHILEEMLGTKADSILAQRQGKPTEMNPNGALEGFGARLQDYLFALLMDLQVDDRKVRLGFVESSEVRTRIGVAKNLKSSDCLREMVRASFSCNSDRKGGCSFEFLEGTKIVTEAPQKSNAAAALQVGSLLEHLGFTLDGAVVKTGESYYVALRSIHNDQPAGRLKIDFEEGKSDLKAEIKPDSSNPPPRWPKELELSPLSVYRQVSLGKNKKNAAGKRIIAEFQKEGGKWRFGETRVTCPIHKATPLKAKSPFEEIQRRPVPGGLFDRKLFGDMASAGKRDDKGHWAYIELPTDITYPLDAFFDGNSSRVDRFVDENAIDLQKLPRIKAIPVLPLRYRMSRLHFNPPKQDELVKYGYVPLFDACGKYAKAKSNRAQKRAVADIEESVRELFRLLVGRLEKKEGHIRRDGLGRRVDRSARLVITPNPRLRWDEAGIPTTVLIELLRDEFGKWMQEKRDSKDLAQMFSILLAGKSVHHLLREWSWQRSKKDDELRKHATGLLSQFLKAHPEILVILNRQPSLHRDSMQAFHPVPLPPEAGDVIQLCPLVCRGFGADFDGDEMAVHIPVSAEARKEATELLPSRNMLSLANGEILAQYEQDFVLGLYWLSREDVGSPDTLRQVLLDTCCRDLVSGKKITKAEGAALLKHLAEKHPDAAPGVICQLSDLAFDCCARTGVSFGFYDLLELSKGCSEDVKHCCEASAQYDKPERINGHLQEIVEESLKQMLNRDVALETSGLHFAAMAISGARGQDQVRQLVGARGFLHPGFETSDKQFTIQSSLVDGMESAQAFDAAMNSRSSMCDKQLVTSQSGYLTRRLITALWPMDIVAPDCKNAADKLKLISCRAEGGFCAKCYGLLPDGSEARVGFPAGLIAAQSIGERGTQLSMQSFHTGEKSDSIEDVLDILDGRQDERFFDAVEDAARFIQKMKHSKTYKNIHDRHFQILWRAINQSPGHSLRSATQLTGWVTRVSFEEQAKQLLLWACSGESSSLTEPTSRVLFNLFGSRRPSEGAKS